MTVLTQLKQAFQKKHEVEKVSNETALMLLAERHVDGEEITPDELNAVIIPGSRVKLVCPRSSSHKGQRQIGIDPQTKKTKCVCDDCGEQWQQVVDQTELRPGDLVFEDFEAIVARIQNRRRLHDQLALLPDAKATETKLLAKRQAALDAFDKARKERDRIFLETDSELNTAAMVVRNGEAARQKLKDDCYDPELLAEAHRLREERSRLPTEELRQDLWGYEVGRFDSVVRESAGSNLCVRLRRVASHDGIIDGARETHGIDFSSASHALKDPKIRKVFGRWFAPSSKQFRDAIKVDLSRGTGQQRAQYDKDLKAYVSFWKSTFEPKLTQWIRCIEREEALDAELLEVHEQMLEV